MGRLHRIAVAAALVCAGSMLTAAVAQDTDHDGIPDELEETLGTTVGVAEQLVAVGESPARESEAPDLRRFYMCHVGGDRFLWKVEFDRPFPRSGVTMVLYLDADNNPRSGRQDKPEVVGTDVQYGCSGSRVSASITNAAIYPQGGTAARGRALDNAVWVCDDLNLHTEDGKAVVRMRLLVQRAAGGSDSTEFATVSVPLHAERTKPELPGPRRLSYKGLTREEVERGPDDPPLPERRARPPVPYATEARSPEKGATVERRRLSLALLEEAGVARPGELVAAGVPFARGVIFDPAMIRVLDATGSEAPAQVTVTAFWPDDSIKWVLVEFLADFGAGQQRDYALEFGSAVRRAPLAQALQVSEDAGAVTVDTGPLQVTVSKTRFSILEQVRVRRQPLASCPQGMVVVGEKGEVFALAGGAPEVRTERRGPLTTTLRLEGPYVGEGGREYLRAIVRLTFVAGSPTVRVDATHVDDYLETEFTDLRSLQMPLSLATGAARATYLIPEGDGKLRAVALPLTDGAARLMQKDDTQFELTGEQAMAGRRAPGVMDYQAADGSGVAVAVKDFWQEYPKGLRATPEACNLEMLPSLEGQDFYQDLPWQLGFPFMEGCYRLKWGMAKTTRVWLTFHGAEAPDLAAMAGRQALPIVAVMPSEHYAATRALGDMAPMREGRFQAWDAEVARCFEDHMTRKQAEREYGFLNWGDWYGERGRNWGNNEYDLPHGLYMQFARTGNRDYFRCALAAARHMADVDCVHAYPDPLHLGAMQLHSVCHTGEWSQTLAQPEWSFRYDYHTTAANGHTWADGLIDTWYLTGDPRVMEVAQGLGEHIAYAMAPTFTKLGTHERSAGWSLAAIMAIYRATGDPVYLQAAKQIVQVALDEQDLADTGAWPHVLPGDHAQGYPGAVGNVTFLIGVLTAGIQDYHQETGDARALESLKAAMPWMKSMWIPQRWHFHYTSSPYYLQNPQVSNSGCTMLVIPPMAYVAEQTGDAELTDIVGKAFAGVLRDGGNGWGKSYAQLLFFGADVLGALDRADDTRPDVRLAVHADAQQLRDRFLENSPAATELHLRGPKEKLVYLLREGTEPFKVTAVRKPYGARQRQDETGSIQLVGPDGTVLKQAEFDTNDEFEFVAELPATAARGVYELKISDDLRATWDARSSETGRVVALTDGLDLGGIGGARYALYAPPGVSKFTLTAIDWHRGRFGAIVFGPDGSVLASGDQTHTAEGEDTAVTLEVGLGDNPTGRLVEVVLHSTLDLRVAVQGLPPYLALTPEQWFNPADH